MNGEAPIKVYIKVNEQKEIVEINSEIFIKDLSGWIQIDEGFGDKFAHAQGLYLPAPILGDNGYNFIYENGVISPKGE